MSTVRCAMGALLCVAAFWQPRSAAQDVTGPAKPATTLVKTDPAKLKQWLDLWQTHIVNDERNRNCDKVMGEDIGWLMTPFMGGFYYGYMATRDTRWIDREFDWADSWIGRGVTEPDGYIGWPRTGAAGTAVDDLDSYYADSMLGEAMAMRPLVLMSAGVLKDPALRATYGGKAEGYIKLSEQLYEKWDTRGAWRETEGGGMISVVLPFGINRQTGKWDTGYETRNAPGQGFSHPNNKANYVACWLLAMYDATGKPAYSERAEKWFKLMKSRMKPKDDGTYEIWNYWQPAGLWDYKADGSAKHWIGVHPNGGYYFIDTAGIVDAYEHGLVFTKADIARLSATALATNRNWSSLVPYSPEIQKGFEAGLRPNGWGGLSSAPWYLYLQSQLE